MTAPTGAAGVATPYSSIQMGTGVATDKTSLGNDQFLNLLVTQMRYQDPSSPMDSAQIMATTTQLATVEQLTELTTTQRESFALQMRLSASGFIGQQVSWTDEAKTTQRGTVEGASFEGATPMLVVGGKQVALDAVALLGAPATAEAAATATATAAAAAKPVTKPTDGAGGALTT